MEIENHIKEIQEILFKISSDIVLQKSDNNYGSQKQKILRIYKTTGNTNYDQESIELRLIVIDSLYSTNMSKRYFAFEDLSAAIYSLGPNEKEVIKKIQNFRNDPKSTPEVFCIFDVNEYGIHKNGKTAGEAKSLLSKYFYFQLMIEVEDKIGFPIYDSLAKNMFNPVCKYAGLMDVTKISSNSNVNILSYLTLLKRLASQLNINGQYDLQDFDILDAYLWRMGKFSEGNFSLLLNKDEYLTLIKAYNLEGYEKPNKNAPEVNNLLKDEMLKGYKTILDNEMFNELWKHWLNLFR